MECLLAIFFLGVLVGGIVGLGAFVLQPLGYLSGKRVPRVSYQLIDLFCLIALLQPPLALVTFVLRSEGAKFEYNFGTLLAILAVVWVGTGVVWAGFVASLSRRGITSQLRRAVAELVVLPVIGWIVPFAVVVGFLLISILANTGVGGWDFSITLGIEVVLITAIFAGRMSAAWIAKGMAANVASEASGPQDIAESHS